MMRAIFLKELFQKIIILQLFLYSFIAYAHNGESHDDPQNGKEAFLERELQLQIFLAEEAIKHKIDQQESIKEKINLSTQKILAEAFKEKILSEITITPEELSEFYQKMLSEIGHKRYKVRELNFTSQEQATAFLKQAKLQSDFVKFSQKNAANDIEKITGGDIGWKLIGELPKDFQEEVKTKNQLGLIQFISKNNGWKVFYIEEIVAFKPSDLDAIKNQLTLELKLQKLHETIELLYYKKNSQTES